MQALLRLSSRACRLQGASNLPVTGARAARDVPTITVVHALYSHVMVHCHDQPVMITGSQSVPHRAASDWPVSRLHTSRWPMHGTASD